MNRRALVAASIGLTTSCGFRAPAQSSGPSRSPDGVTVAVRGEKCRPDSAAPTQGQGTTLEILIEAVNASDDQVKLRPSNLRIVSPAGYAETAASETEDMWVRSGDRAAVVKTFRGAPGTTCSDKVQVGVTGAVISPDGKPMELPSIMFVAGR